MKKNRDKKSLKSIELKQAEQQRDNLQRNSFKFMIEMIAIIGIPAFLASYYGKKIGIANGTHPRILIIFLIIALIFSWSIIIYRFVKISRKISHNDQEIKKLKKDI